MFYDSVTKKERNSYEYSRDSAGFDLNAEFTTMYNNLLISVGGGSIPKWLFLQVYRDILFLWYVSWYSLAISRYFQIYL